MSCFKSFSLSYTWRCHRLGMAISFKWRSEALTPQGLGSYHLIEILQSYHFPVCIMIQWGAGPTALWILMQFIICEPIKFICGLEMLHILQCHLSALEIYVFGCRIFKTFVRFHELFAWKNLEILFLVGMWLRRDQPLIFGNFECVFLQRGKLGTSMGHAGCRDYHSSYQILFF
jgi:hypothetical protein